MLFPHLGLPATQIGTPVQQSTGLLDSGFTFVYDTGTLAPKSPAWQGVAVKAADAASVPVLYSPAFLAALKAGATPPFNVPNQNKVLLDRVPAFGQKGSLVRLPRVVSFSDQAAGGAAQAWVNANASWLVPNQIMVVQVQAAVLVFGGPGIYGLFALESGLPLTGVTIVNEGAFLGDYAVGTVDPNFVAGSCFEVRKWLADYTDNGDAAVGFHVKQAAADVATNKAIFPRFAKRAVYSYGSYDSSGNDVAIRNFQLGLLTQLAGYGFDPNLTNTFSISDSAYFDTLTPAAKAFFGVP